MSAADGLTAYDLDDAAVKKASIASARRTLVASDGSKLGRTAFAYVGPSALLHTLVTDDTAPPTRWARWRTPAPSSPPSDHVRGPVGFSE